MDKFSKLGKLSSTFLSQPRSEEFQNLLELFPYPVLIFNIKQNRFFTTNTQAILATAYIQEEFQHLPISKIFPEFSTIEKLLSTNQPENIQILQQRSGIRKEITLQTSFLDKDKDWVFIGMQNISSNKSDIQPSPTFQIGMEEYLKVINSSTKQKAFRMLHSMLKRTLAIKKVEILKKNNSNLHESVLSSSLITDIKIDLNQQKYSTFLNTSHILLGAPKEFELIDEGKYLSIFCSPNNDDYAILLIDNVTIDPLVYPFLESIVLEILILIDLSFAKNNKTNMTIVESSVKNSIINSLKTSTEDGLLFVTPNLEIKESNQQIEEMLGYRPNEIIGRKLKEIIISASGDLDIKEFKEASPLSRDFGETHLLKRNSESIPVQIKSIGIMREEKVFLILVRVMDLSEFEIIKNNEKKLEQNALLGDLMAIFAHDVRNPIHNINTGLELMSMDFEDNPKLLAEIKVIIEDGERLITLMNSVLAFSKSFKDNMEELDLNILIGGLLIRMRNVFLKSNIQQYFNPPDMPSIIKGDKKSLERVFENIFVNAINAMSLQESGNLGVELNHVKNKSGIEVVEIKISDTGPGIPKEDLKKIFLPFYSTEQKGTGLGLAITKRTIDTHRGEINVESIAGGTIFSIRIPKL